MRSRGSRRPDLRLLIYRDCVCNVIFLYVNEKYEDLFRLCPPVRYARPFSEQVSLHGKSLCKNIGPTKLGATNGKDPNTRRTIQ